MTRPYKLLIKGELVQTTAFSTGGAEETDSPLDLPMARNRNGRLILRGSSLAGAFIATAKELFHALPQNITEGPPSVQLKHNIGATRPEKLPRLNESVWIFHHAHPVDTEPEPATEVRDNVAISHKTGAARHGAKFDGEIVPAGTRWHFLMEVDRYRDQADDLACAMALSVAERWQTRCWLGRDVARGLGWMQLENIEVYELDAEDALVWPDATQEPLTALKALQAKRRKEPLAGALPPDKQPCQAGGSIIVEVDPDADEDTWGLDFLSVGGTKDVDPGTTPGKNFLRSCHAAGRLVRPLGENPHTYLKGDKPEKDIDFRIATTRGGAGGEVPYIPGASLRGSMRHALAWLLRRRGETVWEPGEKPVVEDQVTQLFGSTRNSARLLIGDARLLDDDWQALLLEMHAEDEFTGGVCGDSKFDRTCLVKGRFEAPWHLQAADEASLQASIAMMKQLARLAEARRIPLGGSQWRGLGWVKLTFTGIPETQVAEAQEAHHE